MGEDQKEKDLCYRVSEYQRYLWRYRKMIDESALASERNGSKKYEAFPDFSGEIFHRLYSYEPCKMEEPAPGSEPYQKLHEQMTRIPEVDDLADRCRGDEEWAGIGTGTIIDTVLNDIDSEDERVEDTRQDMESMESLMNMLEENDDEEIRNTIRDAISEKHEQITKKHQKSKQFASMIDASQTREAIRDACAKAMDEINDREKAYDSFLAGDEQHSGQQARRASSKIIAKALQENERIKKIAQLAGRLRRIAIEQQRQKPKRGTDEITGIELGDNLAKILPAEALFMFPELEVIFAKKFNEKSLQQFELNRQPPKQQGPIVVLLDSSASMLYNKADAWAAAVALAFLEIARKQGRAFAIVHFGNDVKRVDEWAAKKDINLQSLLDAVSFFASSGGTNFERPIEKGINIIKDHGAFKEADITMVTDGQASVSTKWLSDYKKERDELGFNLYSVVIGLNVQPEKTENQKFSDEVVSLQDVIKDDKAMHKIFGRV